MTGQNLTIKSFSSTPNPSVVHGGGSSSRKSSGSGNSSGGESKDSYTYNPKTNTYTVTSGGNVYRNVAGFNRDASGNISEVMVTGSGGVKTTYSTRGGEATAVQSKEAYYNIKDQGGVYAGTGARLDVSTTAGEKTLEGLGLYMVKAQTTPAMASPEQINAAVGTGSTAATLLETSPGIWKYNPDVYKNLLPEQKSFVESELTKSGYGYSQGVFEKFEKKQGQPVMSLSELTGILSRTGMSGAAASLTTAQRSQLEKMSAKIDKLSSELGTEYSRVTAMPETTQYEQGAKQEAANAYNAKLETYRANITKAENLSSQYETSAAKYYTGLGYTGVSTMAGTTFTPPAVASKTGIGRKISVGKGGFEYSETGDTAKLAVGKRGREALVGEPNIPYDRIFLTGDVVQYAIKGPEGWKEVSKGLDIGIAKTQKQLEEKGVSRIYTMSPTTTSLFGIFAPAVAIAGASFESGKLVIPLLIQKPSDIMLTYKSPYEKVKFDPTSAYLSAGASQFGMQMPILLAESYSTFSMAGGAIKDVAAFAIRSAGKSVIVGAAKVAGKYGFEPIVIASAKGGFLEAAEITAKGVYQGISQPARLVTEAPFIGKKLEALPFVGKYIRPIGEITSAVGIGGAYLGEKTSLYKTDFGKGVVWGEREYLRYITLQSTGEERSSYAVGSTIANVPYSGLKVLQSFTVGTKARVPVEVIYKVANIGAVISMFGVNVQQIGKEEGVADTTKIGGFELPKGIPSVKIPSTGGIVEAAGRTAGQLIFTEIYAESKAYDPFFEESSIAKAAKARTAVVVTAGKATAGKISAAEYNRLWSGIDYFEGKIGGRTEVTPLGIGSRPVVTVDIGKVTAGKQSFATVDFAKIDFARIESGRPDIGKVDVGKVEIRTDLGKIDVGKIDIGRIDIKPDSKIEKRLGIDIKIDTRIEPKIEPRFEPRIEPFGRVDMPRIDIKFDIREDIKPDAKLDAKLDIKPDFRIDAPGFSLLPFAFLGGLGSGGGGTGESYGGKAGKAMRVQDLLSITLGTRSNIVTQKMPRISLGSRKKGVSVRSMFG